jgi:hypothetical protein
MIRRLPADTETGEEQAFNAAGGASCPPPDLLGPALAGVVPDPVGAAVRAHVAQCDACRTLIDALDDASVLAPAEDEARRIRTRVAASRTRALPSARLALAASLLAAGGIIILVRLVSTPTQVPPPEPPRSVDAPRAARFVLALTAPAIVLPESVLVLRGGVREPYATGLTHALETFRRGEYAAAARSLAAVRARYPSRPHAAFYLGAALLMDGRSGDALKPLTESLQLATGNVWLTDEAAWYLAVAFERASRPDSAIEVLSTLCSRAGERRDAACEGLTELTRSIRRGHGGRGASDGSNCERSAALPGTEHFGRACAVHA